jgi:FKBP-type peptidyl-prolyl cis-trans isomerase
MNDSVLDYNRDVVRTEEQEIDDLIRRYGWQMTESSTGLRYMIYHKSSGEKAMKGKKATITYEVRLLNGNVCYSFTASQPREILIGREETEQGLQEGILCMRVGDRAKFIVPSHLAFGLLGDQDKIPPKSALIYDVELVKLNNP